MRKLSVLAAIFTATLASAAAAETQGPADVRSEGDATVYDFRDADGLQAEGRGAIGGVIKLRSPIVRRTLIRPRASFVPEMLRSVEAI